MPLSALVVAEFGQQRRRDPDAPPHGRVGAERSFVVFPRGLELAASKRTLPRFTWLMGSSGWPGDGFRVRGARGGSISGGVQQRAQIVQRQTVRRLARQQLDVSVAGFEGPAHFREQTGAIESQTHMHPDSTRCELGDRVMQTPARVAAADRPEVGAHGSERHWFPWRAPAPPSFPPACRSRVRLVR